MLQKSEIRMIAEEVASLLDLDELMTPDRAADYLGITKEALRKRAMRGQIPCHKHGSSTYFSKREIISLLLGRS